MNNTEFLELSTEEKIQELISRIKKSVTQGAQIEPVFYLFDHTNKLHVIEIEDKFLLKSDNHNILNALIKEKIKELNSRNRTIEKVLFLREGFYNPAHTDKLNMNLEKDFTYSNANEALIVTQEDVFSFEIKVFDLIKIHDEGKSISVISEKPIDEIEFCKIDPEFNIKTNYINLIE